MSLEFKLPSGSANTGVYFRNPGNRTGWDGMMAQIVSDNSKFPANMHSGGITKFVAPAVDALRPAGQWNSMDIDCRGPHVRIMVNGQVTVDVDTSQVVSLADRPRSGYIGLANYQGEANGAAFRNIRIRELPSESPSPTDVADSWTDLFNGRDLSG